MDFTLAESLGGIYHLVISGSAVVGCFIVALGLPGQFFPGLVATIFWASGATGVDEAPIATGGDALLLLGLALLAEGFEFVSGLIGGRAAGSRWRGALGGMAGGFVGAIFGNLILPLVGGIVGIIVGTFVGAVIGESTGEEAVDENQALKVGFASAIGRTLGLVAKLAICFAIGFWALIVWLF